MYQIMRPLEHYGYGAAFNRLTVDAGHTRVHKRCVAKAGQRKIRHEIAALHELGRYLRVPRIFGVDVDGLGYTMAWVRGPTVHDSDNRADLIPQVHQHLRELHINTARPVDRETVLADLRIETVTKIRVRHCEIAHQLEPYDGVTKVNGAPVLPFDELVTAIGSLCLAEVGATPMYAVLHGDCHFKNILVDEASGALVYIDPRGCFGTTATRGLADYDDAKFQFALSGYCEFDGRVDSAVTRVGATGVRVRMPTAIAGPPAASRLATLLMATIWLGNAHCFRDTPHKAVESHFIARRIATDVLIAARAR